MVDLKEFSLDNKVAIVTGATRGLGQGIAIGLAKAGADIVCVGRSDDSETKKTIEGLGRKYLRVCTDVGLETAPDEIVEKTLAVFGKIDILVNAAGITRRAMALEVTRKDWQDVLDVNLTGLFFLCQAVAKQFVKQGGKGKIINIGSMTSFQGGIKVIPYTASKAAVRMITMHMCNEWAKYGIHINCIAPGYMITNMTAPMRSESSRMVETNTRIPMDRWGVPGDLAGAAVFLASEASDYVNGFTLAVDGGFLAKS
ncbi:SDR family oxidoreductase [uncultured Sphaerochaeta sp.]|uniref:SDR family oxidoreductase n=1 Tax=uncultured Sphaerochaeta sp. TaxID=886478 RepID=UPI002A0A2486|nr:SDR family oxidoreductase [uncultured Sphaerochaeta sp.]